MPRRRRLAKLALVDRAAGMGPATVASIQNVTTDEAAAVERARAGSADAVSWLHRRYYPLAWQWAYALTGDRTRVDDVAQEAILRAFRALDRFDPQRPFGPWLRRIVLNAGRDELRKLRRGALSEAWMADRVTPAEGAERPGDEIVAAVRALAPARRVVIVLHYWLDLPIDAVAAELGIPYGTAASRLSRALADLERLLEESRV